MSADIAQMYVALRFMNEFASRRPDVEYVLSIDSEARRAVAETCTRAQDIIMPPPSRFPPVLGRTISTIGPAFVVVIGNALRCDMMRLAQKRGIPVVWIGGEFNSGDFKTWGQSPDFTGLAGSIDIICMAAEAQKSRLMTLGFDGGRIHVVGSAKYDSVDTTGDGKARAREILRAAGIGSENLVLVAGSTWVGEDSILLDLYIELKARFKQLVLVLAPRRKEHFQHAVREIRRRNLAMALRSKLDLSGMRPHENRGQCPDVLMIDSEGDLRSIYAWATVVFVGRSLTHKPGSNIIEAAAHGKPIVVGPHMEHFLEVLDDFLAARAVLQVRTAGELKRVIGELLGDSGRRRDCGRRARRVVDQKSGAIRKTVDLLETKLFQARSVL